MNRVMVVGDAMLDRYYFGSVTRISPEAPIPIVKVNRVEDRLGGAANVANNLAHLTAVTSLMSITGVDEPGLALANKLREYDIAPFISKDPYGTTTLKLRTVVGGHQVSRTDFDSKPSTTTQIGLLNQFERLYQDYDVVVFSDYNKGTLGYIERMIQLCNESNIKTIVDPKGKDWEKYSGCYMITPNEKELQDAIGVWKDDGELTRNVKELMAAFNITQVLLTRSERGMTLFNQFQTHYKTEAKSVVDVTGAGDTVVATMAWALANNYSLNKSIELANKAAGIVVSKLGTSVVSHDELL